MQHLAECFNNFFKVLVTVSVIVWRYTHSFAENAAEKVWIGIPDCQTYLLDG